MSELESMLNYLETTSMEPHDDYTSEFSYKEQKVLWKYIKELQQKNQKYKEVIDKAVEKIESWYFALDYAERDRLKIIVEILKEVK